MVKKILIITLLILAGLTLRSQTLSKEYLRDVQEADQYYYYDENFEMAAGLFIPLYKQYPDNSNLAAKLGICYLNIDGMRSEALNLLRKASKNVVASDNDYIEYGEKAPLETYFYLAFAYHLNDSLDKAIALYTEVKKKYNPSSTFRVDYIDNQIKACRFAIEQQKTPVQVTADLFTSWMKDYPGACNPVISDNDSVFIFTVQKGGISKIFCSYKTGTWGKPVDITGQLGNYENMSSNSITGNGQTLIIYMEVKGDGNIYYSNRNGKVWSKVKKFDKDINTKYWESHGFITADGNKLFIASNRPGGTGELDIYTSVKNLKGQWGPVINAGRTINTIYNENTPFFDQKNSTLYFSSIGLQGMGEYDLFSSIFTSNRWSKPVGFPYPINNTSGNTFFTANLDGSDFITSIFYYKPGIRNIYRLTVSTVTSAGSTLAAGSYSLQDGMLISQPVQEVIVASSETNGVIKQAEVISPVATAPVPKPVDNPPQVSRNDIKTDTVKLNIANAAPVKTVEVPKANTTEKAITGDVFSIKSEIVEEAPAKVYTIQVYAMRNKLSDQSFNGLQDVEELHGTDGYYRYVYGKFDSVSKAKAAVIDVYVAGFSDAFVREYNILIQQTVNP